MFAKGDIVQVRATGEETTVLHVDEKLNRPVICMGERQYSFADLKMVKRSDIPFRSGDVIQPVGSKKLLTVRKFIPNLLPPIAVKEESGFYFVEKVRLVHKVEDLDAGTPDTAESQS